MMDDDGCIQLNENKSWTPKSKWVSSPSAMIGDFILVSPAEVQILAQQWLPRSLGLKMKTDWGCQQPWIPLRTKPIIDGSSAFSCHTTTYYVKIWGTPQRDGPLWKSATTWDFEILNLGRSFDIQPHISFDNRKHPVINYEHPYLWGICSCAVCVVLDEVPSRGHSLGWHSLLGVRGVKTMWLYQYILLC